jgi:hypothetical protein
MADEEVETKNVTTKLERIALGNINGKYDCPHLAICYFLAKYRVYREPR